MISVQSLSFTYPKQKISTIKDIQLHIQKNEVFGFIGPSGAGKSTTQKILIGLLKGYEGSVNVLGKEVKDWGADFYEHIGVAFEFPHFYHKFTAKENLQHFQRFYSKADNDINELLEMVGLEKATNTRVSDFSKGMKMRLNFCRALIHDPSVLFLDEPTSGLDPVNAKKLRDKIVQLKNDGKTIVITTHNMAFAQDICDRVAFIIDGQIKLIDSPKQLMIDKGQKVVKVEYVLNGKRVDQDFNLHSLHENERFLHLLATGTVETIHTLEASLEDIFIEVTGRSLS